MVIYLQMGPNTPNCSYIAVTSSYTRDFGLYMQYTGSEQVLI